MFDAGDPGGGDDVDARTKYTASDPACLKTYIVGTPTVFEVSSGGTRMRYRESWATNWGQKYSMP